MMVRSAFLAGIDHATQRSRVTDPIAGNGTADLGDAADDMPHDR